MDATFRDWSRSLAGEQADKVASLLGVVTFHHDPGSLSAAFVAERLGRAATVPPTVRYVPGGWGVLVDRLADRARALGAELVTGSPVDELPGGPVVLAVPLRAATRLLGDEVEWTGARTALLDIGVDRRRGDPFIVADLDESGWAETFSIPDRSLAPTGQHLVQAQIGIRPDEDLASAVARAEGLLDVGFDGWRDRVRWRRQAKIDSESGALDMPGTTWRDRPAIDRGDDVHLVGDMVAAPGLLAEVTHTSALTAIASIAERQRTRAVLG